MLSLLGCIFGRKVVLFCTFRLESRMDDRYLRSKTKTTQWIVWKAYHMTVGLNEPQTSFSWSNNPLFTKIKWLGVWWQRCSLWGPTQGRAFVQKVENVLSLLVQGHDVMYSYVALLCCNGTCQTVFSFILFFFRNRGAVFHYFKIFLWNNWQYHLLNLQKVKLKCQSFHKW